mgnify:CR=1 FL=1
MTILTQIPTVAMQRSKGEAAVTLAFSAGRVALRGLRQRGSAKAILPHVGAVPEVVFLNTSGGLTGGDRLAYGLSVGDGARAVATTQTAERAYLSAEGVARVDVALSVGSGRLFGALLETISTCTSPLPSGMTCFDMPATTPMEPMREVDDTTIDEAAEPIQ